MDVPVSEIYTIIYQQLWNMIKNCMVPKGMSYFFTFNLIPPIMIGRTW
jgi:hypothetical protein